MKLKIDENWQNFDQYLAALRTKFRVKAKKAMELSSTLLVRKKCLILKILIINFKK